MSTVLIKAFSRSGFGLAHTPRPSIASQPFSTHYRLLASQDSESVEVEGRELLNMSSSTPFKQDMPPPGGFEPVRYKRNLPIRGPGGIAIFGGVAAVCTYGFYLLGKGNLEKRELRRELAWSRIHLTPLLLAEQDRDAYRRGVAAEAREREIMGDVEGWEVGKKPYHTARYTAPNIVVL